MGSIPIYNLEELVAESLERQLIHALRRGPLADDFNTLIHHISGRCSREQLRTAIDKSLKKGDIVRYYDNQKKRDMFRLSKKKKKK